MGCLVRNRWQKNLNPNNGTIASPSMARRFPTAKSVVCGDSQEVMDREIAYWHAAGLDYWAFLHYHPRRSHVADSYNYGLRLYLNSKHKADIRFCVIIYPVKGTEWLSRWKMSCNMSRSPRT